MRVALVVTTGLVLMDNVVSLTPAHGISRSKYNGESILQAESSGWKTCTSCKISNPESVSQVKLEIKDVKDNVDFHFDNFIKELNIHFSSIKEGIDNSYLPRLQKACDSVVYKLENIKAQIKVNYTDVCSKFRGDKNDIKRMDKRLKDAKGLVSEFVLKGKESFLKIFKELQKEFKSPNLKAENKRDSVSPNAPSVNAETSNDVDLKNIPPEAIIRTIESFLTDLRVEGGKLMDKVLFQ